MGGQLLAQKTVLLAKLETNYGEDSNPNVSANEIEVFDLDIKPAFEKVVRKPLRASLSPQPIGKSKFLNELTFTTELKGSGTKGVAGRLSALFQACGMSESVSVGSSVTYTPGTPTSSITAYVYRDGLLFKLLGGRGTFEITSEAGKIPLIKWAFKGVYVQPTDAALPSPTYETTIGQVAQSAQCTIDSFSDGIVRSFSVNLAADTVDRPNMNAAGAIEGVHIPTRTPTGKILLEAEKKSVYDFWAAHDDVPVIELSATFGATDGNIVDVEADSQIDDIGVTDESGIMMFDIGLVFSGTDDEFKITMR